MNRTFQLSDESVPGPEQTFKQPFILWRLDTDTALIKARRVHSPTCHRMLRALSFCV